MTSYADLSLLDGFRWRYRNVIAVTRCFGSRSGGKGHGFKGLVSSSRTFRISRTTCVTSTCSSPENDRITRIRYARAVSRHSPTAAVFLAMSDNIADIAPPRITAPPAAMFGHGFCRRSDFSWHVIPCSLSPTISKEMPPPSWWRSLNDSHSSQTIVPSPK